MFISQRTLSREREKASQTTENTRSSHCGTVVTNPTRNHEVVGLIPGLAQWVKNLALP